MEALTPLSSAPRASSEAAGRIAVVTGSAATVELTSRPASAADSPTVGKFMGIVTSKTMIVGLVTEVAEQAIG